MTLDLGSAAATLELSVSSFVKNAEAAGDSLIGIQKKSESANQGMLGWVSKNESHLKTVGGAMSAFGLLTTGVMTLAGKTAMDFEAAMSGVATVSGATAEELEKAKQEVLDIGYQTTLSATEAALAMEVLIKAGVDLEDAVGGVARAAVMLSEATGVDIALASETAAAAMNIFSYEATEAERVMDAISQSANASALDVQDWTLALKYAGPVVSALGWDIEDLADMMVILGDAGIRGEVGATAIRNILLALSNPTQEITAGFAKYNVELFDMNGNLRTMKDITTDLAPAWDGMTQAEKLAFAEMVAGKQGVTSFTALMEDQSAAVRKNENAFDRARRRMKAAGTTSEMAQKRMDNLAGSVEELKGTIETLSITFMSGLTPAIRAGTDALSWILQQFLRLPGPVQTAIAGVTGLVGVLALFGGGTMLAAVKVAELVTAFKGIGGTAALMGPLASGIRAVGAASIALFTNPLILLGALALGGAILAYKNNFLGFGDVVDGAIGKLQQFTGFLFGMPESKTIGVTLDTDLTGEEDAWNNWTKMPDGTWKHATLGISTTGVDATVSWVTDPNSPDGKDWSLNVDVDGDGKDDALRIINSVDHGGGKFVMIAEMNGRQYEVWYDQVTGQAIILEARVELDTAETERKQGHLKKQWQDIANWMGQAKQLLVDIFNGDWGAIDWDSVLGISKIKQDFQDVYNLVSGIFSFFKNDAGKKSPKADDYDKSPDWVNNWGANNLQLDKGGTDGSIGSNYSDPYRPIEGGNQWIEATAISNFIQGMKNAIAAATEFDTTNKTVAATIGGPLAASFSKANADSGLMASGLQYVDGSIMGLGGTSKTTTDTIKGAFGGMSSDVTAKTAAARDSITAAMTSANTQAVAQVLGMRTNTAVQMGLMASSATTQGNTVQSNFVTSLAKVGAGATSALAGLSGAIVGAGLNGAISAYSAGMNISLGFANGMLAYLNVIRSAANQMVAAASQALIARAMIHSPSKLFQGYGEYVGEGFELGILSSIPGIRSAANQMLGASLPTPAFSSGGGSLAGAGGTTIVNNYYVMPDEMVRIMDGAEKGHALHAVMTDPNSASQYRKVGGR